MKEFIFRITIISICLSIAIKSTCVFKKKKSKALVTQGHKCKRQDVDAFFEALPFVSWALFGIVVIDSVFSLFKFCNIAIYSELTYGDTTMLLVNILGSVMIAFFQYRIQDKLDREQSEREREKNRLNQELEAQRHNYESSIRNLETERHVKEIKATRLRYFYSLSNCQCTAKNYNLPETGLRKDGRKEPYVIKLISRNNVPCFFQPDLKLLGEKSVEISISDENNFVPISGDFQLTCTKLELYLNETYPNLSNIKDFFLRPVVPIQRSYNSSKLYIKISIDAEDPALHQSYGEMANKMKYTLICCLYPNSGYDNSGGFSMSISVIRVMM